MLYILILVLPLIFYAVFACVILFHLNRYSINEFATKKITAAFVAVSLVLIIFTSLAFFAIPWNNLGLNDIENYINSFIGQNQSRNLNIIY